MKFYSFNTFPIIPNLGTDCYCINCKIFRLYNVDECRNQIWREFVLQQGKLSWSEHTQKVDIQHNGRLKDILKSIIARSKTYERITTKVHHIITQWSFLPNPGVWTSIDAVNRHYGSESEGQSWRSGIWPSFIITLPYSIYVLPPTSTKIRYWYYSVIGTPEVSPTKVTELFKSDQFLMATPDNVSRPVYRLPSPPPPFPAPIRVC